MQEDTNSKLYEKNEVAEYMSRAMRRNKARSTISGLRSQLEKGENYLANEIFGLIDRHVLCVDSPFQQGLQEGTVLFRARVIDDIAQAKKDGLNISDDHVTTGYDELNSGEPPLGRPGIGRNNIRGVSYLYLASDEYTACSEIKSPISSLISLSRFRIRRLMRIVNLTQEYAFSRSDSEIEGVDLASLFTELMFAFCSPMTSDNDYLISQVVSDYIRKTGVDGIAYSSYFTRGRNYTIFNSCRGNVEFIDSRIILHQMTSDYFWDYNNAHCLPSSLENWEYNVNIAREDLEEMKGCI